MIKIKLNGKITEIKQADELTVNEYIELSKKKYHGLIAYLSTVLKIDEEKLFKSKVKNNFLVQSKIGNVKDFEKLPPKKKLIISGEKHFINQLEVAELGQRFLIEEVLQAQKMEEIELMCFVLAVRICNKMDLNKVNEMKTKLMNEPYIKVLPTAFFLLRRLLLGKRKETNFLQKITRSIMMLRLKSKLVLMKLENILITMRLKPYADY
jgi:hypothetical protein